LFPPSFCYVERKASS